MVSSQWNYLLRTIPDISDLLTPLEKVIHQTFIPVLTGRPPPSKHECDLLALLARLGGLGLTNYKFNNFIICVFQSFWIVYSPTRSIDYSTRPWSPCAPCSDDWNQERYPAEEPSAGKNQADIIYDQLNPLMKRCVDLAEEKGSSSWLSPIPLAEHGFHLHKGEFRDTLHHRYGWNLPNIPQSRNCGTNKSCQDMSYGWGSHR